MVIELVLDADVSPAWFLKEKYERAACAAAVKMAAADGTLLYVPAQWRTTPDQIPFNCANENAGGLRAEVKAIELYR